VLFTRARTQPAAWAALLAFNLAAPLLHARRFLPRCDRGHWERLLSGSAEQQRLATLLRPAHARIEEAIATTEAPQRPADGYAAHFPQEFGSLHRLHVLHGYAALVPRNASWSGSAPRADALIRPGASAMEPGVTRFFFDGGAGDAAVEIETLNAMIVRLPHAQGGVLVRTDTPFPGWRITDATTGSPLGARDAGVTTEILVPPGTARICIRYSPRWWQTGLTLAATAAIALAVVSFRTKRTTRNLMTARTFHL
jgi:hypothetical protein